VLCSDLCRLHPLHSEILTVGCGFESSGVTGSYVCEISEGAAVTFDILLFYSLLIIFLFLKKFSANFLFVFNFAFFLPVICTFTNFYTSVKGRNLFLQELKIGCVVSIMSSGIQVC
jgi:hypothetical protein